MTLTTFAPGVNTSFSSQLNSNFTDLLNRLSDAVPITTPIYVTGTYTIRIAISKTDCIAITAPNIYRSTNNGTNWSTVSTGATTADSLHVCSANSNYMVAFDKDAVAGALYSTNGGSNWTAITAPTGLVDAANRIVYSITKEGRVYVAGVDSGNAVIVKYTDNSGSSWSTVTAPGLTDAGWDTFRILFTPTNDYIGLAIVDSGQNAASSITVNGGSSWSSQTYVNASVGATTMQGLCLFANTNNYTFQFYDMATNTRQEISKLNGNSATYSSFTAGEGTDNRAMFYLGTDKTITARGGTNEYLCYYIDGTSKYLPELAFTGGTESAFGPCATTLTPTAIQMMHIIKAFSSYFDGNHASYYYGI